MKKKKETPAPKPRAETKRRKKRRFGRKVLWLIALSFMASAGLRFGTGPGLAIASNVAELAAKEPAQECETDEDVATVLGLLQEREARVKDRELALIDREQALEVAQQQVRKNLTALAQAEADLERMIAFSSESAENDLGQLTSVYESMKPKQAAAVFTEMDPEFAAGFLARMRSDTAAAIMANLSPDQAYAISVLLAGRNALAPTE